MTVSSQSCKYSNLGLYTVQLSPKVNSCGKVSRVTREWLAYLQTTVKCITLHYSYKVLNAVDYNFFCRYDDNTARNTTSNLTPIVLTQFNCSTETSTEPSEESNG